MQAIDMERKENMATISLCMIVKNEEMHIARCLESVAELVEEIIIVDTGSTDRTLEIASRYTTKVFSYPWKDNFADARNYSFSRASMDYCMWMDADDVLEETEKERFLELKQSLPPDTDIVMMKYNTAFDEAGRPVFPASGRDGSGTAGTTDGPARSMRRFRRTEGSYIPISRSVTKSLAQGSMTGI